MCLGAHGGRGGYVATVGLVLRAAAPRMFMLWVHVFGCTWLVWVVTLLGEKLRWKEEQVTLQCLQCLTLCNHCMQLLHLASKILPGALLRLQ